MATSTFEILPREEAPLPGKECPTHLNGYAIPVVLITLLAAILRAHAITSKSFWLDEGISVQISRLPWTQFLYVLRHREVNMALYYLLLRFWLVMGSTEGLIRGLSVLLSIATIPVVYALGARLFGRNTGVLAAGLLAINAYHVRYAQEARGYALVVFFCVLASWLLVRNLQEPSSARWVAYGVVLGLAVYSHFFGALIIVAHGVSLAFLPRNSLPWRGLMKSARWLTYMMFPIVIVVITVGTGSMRWIPAANLASVLGFFVAISGNGGKLLLFMEALAMGAALITAVKEWRGSARNIGGWGYGFALAWLFVPVIVVLAVSAVRPIFVGRYLNPILPALALLVAAGIMKVQPRVLAWVLGTAVAVMSLIGTASYYRKDFDLDRDDWRTATSYVLDHALPGDGVFFYANFGRLPFEFYKSQRHPVPAWPESLVAVNGSDWGYRDSLFAYLADEIQDAGSGGDRVWIVLDQNTDANGEPNRETDIVHAVYGKGRHLVAMQSFPPITILLFARDSVNSVPSRNTKP